MNDGFLIMGTYYGYPECCKTWFSEHAGEHNEDQLKANNHTGFMPCPACAKLVVDSKLELKDLISNRVCITSFPDEGSRKEAGTYYNKHQYDITTTNK